MFKKISFQRFIIATFAIGFCLSCSDQIAGGIFKSQYPHQRYQRQLRDAGLDGSTLYRQWLEAANASLDDPFEITVPHAEQGYIGIQQVTALGYAFDARQGEKILANLEIQSADTSTRVFMDLFELTLDTARRYSHLTSTDTSSNMLEFNIRQDGRYILRIQPELLAEISFTLQLTAAPSIGNPVVADARQNIGSVFGDSRDGGRRRHEGIDIFAAKGTPVVAAADGTVGRVGNNRLGGKVVWMRPKNHNINLYYAHLDSQLVSSGQVVRQGDTLGLMGNTGNAITTPPHLHFGIYATGGAVDPLPFVRPGKDNPSRISSNAARIADTVRLNANHQGVVRHTPLRVEAALRNGYRAVTPDDKKVFVTQQQVTQLSTSLRALTLQEPKAIYAQADTLSARVSSAEIGDRLRVLAEFDTFLLIDGDHKGWIIR